MRLLPQALPRRVPVSNAEASETVTPWGKMSMAYFAARGDVPVDAMHAAPGLGLHGLLRVPRGAAMTGTRSRPRSPTREAISSAGAAAGRRAGSSAAGPPAPRRPLARPTRSAGDAGRRRGAALLIGCGYVAAGARGRAGRAPCAAALAGATVAPVRSLLRAAAALRGRRRGFAGGSRARGGGAERRAARGRRPGLRARAARRVSPPGREVRRARALRRPRGGRPSIAWRALEGSGRCR